MCSRTVSDTANRLLKRTDSEGSSSVAEKKSSAVPLFRSGHMSAFCAGLGSKGKVGVQRGRETAGVPSFLPPRRVPRRCRPVRDESPPRRGYGVTAAKQKHRRPPVRGVLFYSISSRTENAASCSVLSSLYSISREYALQMQICAQCVTSPLASHSYTSSS